MASTPSAPSARPKPKPGYRPSNKPRPPASRCSNSLETPSYAGPAQMRPICSSDERGEGGQEQRHGAPHRVLAKKPAGLEDSPRGVDHDILHVLKVATPRTGCCGYSQCSPGGSGPS